ncbi:MAG: hypothetical protein AAGB04_11815 [Pseudomonadota bacterium]
MQKEIEMLMMAIHQEQAREKKLLDGVLEAISTAGYARKQMAEQIAQALAESTEAEAQDMARRQNLANDIEDVIVSLRNVAA